MDRWEGIPHIALSLNKYLYGESNPITFIDPSGNNSLNESILTAGIVGVFASILATHNTFRAVGNIAEGIAENGTTTPDGVIISLGISATSAVRGVGLGADFGLDLVWHRKESKWYALPSFGLGLAPLAGFARFRNQFTMSVMAGAIWNMKSVNELKGLGHSGTWPLSIIHLLPTRLLDALIDKNAAPMGYAVRQLAKRAKNQRFKDVSIQAAYSGNVGIIKAGIRANSFGATMGYSGSPLSLNDAMARWPSVFNRIGSTLSQSVDIAEDFGNTLKYVNPMLH